MKRYVHYKYSKLGIKLKVIKTEYSECDYFTTFELYAKEDKLFKRWNLLESLVLGDNNIWSLNIYDPKAVKDRLSKIPKSVEKRRLWF